MSAPDGRPLEPLRAVLDQLRQRGAVTRAELGAGVGLSRTTVSGLLGELKRAGLVAESVPTSPRAPGRPAALVELTAAAGLAVGIDVGRRHLRVVVADLAHRVLDERAVRFAAEGHPDETLRAIAGQVDEMLDGQCAGRRDVLGAGLGIPAPLDARRAVGSSSILPFWRGRVPGDELARLLGLPVHADNDANLGALAEAVWGAGRRYREMVYVKAATGIGAGIVHDRHLLRGVSGTAGEIGHTTVISDGELCRCGNRGCLEMYVGGPALVARLAHAGVEVAGVADVVERARAGDPACVRVLADVGDQAGRAVATLVNLLNPDAVVVGGDLGAADDLVLTSLRARVLRAAVPAAVAGLSVVPAVLGERAEALGAVLLVMHERDPFSDRLLARAQAAISHASEPEPLAAVR